MLGYMGFILSKLNEYLSTPYWSRRLLCILINRRRNLICSAGMWSLTWVLNGFYLGSAYCLYSVRQNLYSAYHLLILLATWLLSWPGTVYFFSSSPSEIFCCASYHSKNILGLQEAGFGALRYLGIPPLSFRKAELLIVGLSEVSAIVSRHNGEIIFLIYSCVLWYIATLVIHVMVYGHAYHATNNIWFAFIARVVRYDSVKRRSSLANISAIISRESFRSLTQLTVLTRTLANSTLCHSYIFPITIS